MAGGVGGDGVAAFEDAKGAALVELEEETVEAVAFLAEGALAARSEFELESFEAQADCGDFHSEIEGDDAFVSGVEALRALGEICTEGVGQTGREFVGTLALLA